MYVPNRRVWWRDALIGGVVTAALLELMKAGFAFYLTRFPTYTIIYGAFAILPIFLLWIYISWLIVLLGASMVAILPDWRGRNWVKTNVPGIAFTDAVNLLYQLWLNRQNPQGLSVRELSHKLERDPDELYGILCKLKSMGLIADTQQDNDEQWVLSCDLRQVSLKQLTKAFLLDRAHTHEGPLEYVFNYLSQFFDQRLSNLEELFESPQGILTGQPAILNADPGQETQYAKSTPEMTVEKAVQSMSELDIGSLVIMEHGQLVGMLTFREIIRHWHAQGDKAQGFTVRSIMDDAPVSVTPNTSADEVQRLMLNNHARYMPVMDGPVLMGQHILGPQAAVNIAQDRRGVPSGATEHYAIKLLFQLDSLIGLVNAAVQDEQCFGKVLFQLHGHVIAQRRDLPVILGRQAFQDCIASMN
uniref:CBS domain-containing protein n=1 Tax=Steinernema glaseri TaxID=37863 RepID=A0A1I7Y4G6_9BILA